MFDSNSTRVLDIESIGSEPNKYIAIETEQQFNGTQTFSQSIFTIENRTMTRLHQFQYSKSTKLLSLKLDHSDCFVKFDRYNSNGFEIYKLNFHSNEMHFKRFDSFQIKENIVKLIPIDENVVIFLSSSSNLNMLHYDRATKRVKRYRKTIPGTIDITAKRFADQIFIATTTIVIGEENIDQTIEIFMYVFDKRNLRIKMY